MRLVLPERSRKVSCYLEYIQTPFHIHQWLRCSFNADKNVAACHEHCILLSSLLSPLCRVFTMTYPKQTTFLGYIYCCSCSVVTICATCYVISPVKLVLYLYISTFRSMCAVYKTVDFCSSLISCFPGMLLRYCLSDSELVPIAPY